MHAVIVIRNIICLDNGAVIEKINIHSFTHGFNCRIEFRIACVYRVGIDRMLLDRQDRIDVKSDVRKCFPYLSYNILIAFDEQVYIAVALAEIVHAIRKKDISRRQPYDRLYIITDRRQILTSVGNDLDRV